MAKGVFTPDANEANKSCYSRVVGRLNILSLLASFAREIRAIRAWNSRNSRVKFTTKQTWIRVMGGASARQLQSRCKMYSCFCKSTKMYIYSSGYPQITTITLSSIVVSDFLPPLAMTSLLEQSSWLVNAAWISAKVQIFQLARMTRQTLNSRRVIRFIRVWCERTLRKCS